MSGTIVTVVIINEIAAKYAFKWAGEIGEEETQKDRKNDIMISEIPKF